MATWWTKQLYNNRFRTIIYSEDLTFCRNILFIFFFLFFANFESYSVGLTELGYDILAVNYVGSIGYGQNQVRALAGHIGDYDVNDCLTVRYK